MNIKFDYELCNRCGLCRKVCGGKRIGIDEEKRPFKIVEAGCNDCGHCIAVCPVNAVFNSRVNMSEFTEIVEPGISVEQFMHLVRNRRSIRNFKKEPLKREHIDQLLEIVRYIPTGSNKQSLKYKFITDPYLLNEISMEIASMLRRSLKIITNPPVKYFVKDKNRKSLQRMVDLFYSGNDTFLRNAPCLLVIYTDEKYFRIPQWDAGIASNTIDLAAQTLGVATLMNGYFVTFANRFKSVRKLVRILQKDSILAAMCLGYPDVKYRKTVYRRPLDVKII